MVRPCCVSVVPCSRGRTLMTPGRKPFSQPCVPIQTLPPARMSRLGLSRSPTTRRLTRCVPSAVGRYRLQTSSSAARRPAPLSRPMTASGLHSARSHPSSAKRSRITTSPGFRTPRLPQSSADLSTLPDARHMTVSTLCAVATALPRTPYHQKEPIHDQLQ